MIGEKAYLLATRLRVILSEYPNKLDDKIRNEVYREYLFLLRKAAYSGHLEAQYDLAQQYETMSFLAINNPMSNPKKRIYWYTKACERNHPEACNNLASLYELGEGCDKNLDLALALYKKSAELGSPNGKENYKIMIKDMANGGMYSLHG
ncbi:tetratricopeptide repeat protein [Pedobacter helvus]|uniref:Tetratricopeptide repeat protein n=1 Tax=Pedobacter helvus TaxID=2563444 RepID=A0ABW9JCH6_9SPHI|nr:tetratricopeptide repeat protein [Pedobacter ureilyticus]